MPALHHASRALQRRGGVGPVLVEERLYLLKTREVVVLVGTDATSNVVVVVGVEELVEVTPPLLPADSGLAGELRDVDDRPSARDEIQVLALVPPLRDDWSVGVFASGKELRIGRGPHCLGCEVGAPAVRRE